MSNKLKATLWLLLAIINFLLFAYNIEKDRDFWTWGWLLTSQVAFLGSLRFWIMHDRNRK